MGFDFSLDYKFRKNIKNKNIAICPRSHKVLVIKTKTDVFNTSVIIVVHVEMPVVLQTGQGEIILLEDIHSNCSISHSTEHHSLFRTMRQKICKGLFS